MIDAIKTRTFPEHNYHAVWHKGKTIRIAIDPSEPITSLKFPEFYDVKITDQCNGECPYCYQDSKKKTPHYSSLILNFLGYFKNMSEKERPFQIAIGGGEPTNHPRFCDLLHTSDLLGIVPNYTTNGMWVDSGPVKMADILGATKDYCGGVAVSCHPHLEKYWKTALNLYALNGITTNLHIIISDKASVDRFIEIYKEFSGKVEYFVLLPHTAAGRAKSIEIAWEYLVEKMPDTKQVAFGANFHPYLVGQKDNIFDVSLYEPEIMSGYLDMKDMKLYKSSFNLEERGV